MASVQLETGEAGLDGVELRIDEIKGGAAATEVDKAVPGECEVRSAKEGTDSINLTVVIASIVAKTINDLVTRCDEPRNGFGGSPTLLSGVSTLSDSNSVFNSISGSVADDVGSSGKPSARTCE